MLSEKHCLQVRIVLSTSHSDSTPKFMYMYVQLMGSICLREGQNIKTSMFENESFNPFMELIVSGPFQGPMKVYVGPFKVISGCIGPCKAPYEAI